MRKRELTQIFASFMLVGTVLAGCSSNETEKTTAEEKPAEETADEAAAEETEETAVFNVEESDAAKQAQAYKVLMDELGKAKEGQEVDWELVTNTYSSELQAPINETAGDFDQMIQAAIEGGKAGQIDAVIAKQLVDKTTQSYFYQKQKSLHKDASAALEAGNADEAKQAFEQIKYLAAELFIPTAMKRDEYYELTGEKSMEENINAGLAAQEEALNAGNVDDFNVYIQLTDKSIYRSYYLAVNSYAEKIAAAVAEGKDELELQNMQAEAYGFYQSIKESLSGGDEAAASKLDELFALDKTKAADLKPEEVSSLFVKAIAGKINGYHEKVPATLEVGTTEARVQALEGNMFLKMIEVELVKAIGEEKTAETLETAQAWLDAVSAENKEEAKTHSDAVLAVVNGL